jgi:dTDP-4-amino-4,6-dideoxygalactose transaminase
MVSIPQFDLVEQFQSIREQLMAAVTRVIESQRFILGEPNAEFEGRIAEYCGARHGVGCASGSDALYLALAAVGVEPGDEVLTVPYTFFATAGAVVRCGARPVFVDIQPGTLNMDVDQVESVLDRHPRIKAVLPVHLFGACVDMDRLMAITAARSIPVIEDAAQSIGAEYKGRRAGSLGDLACFSFFPSKNLGAWGDGGMVTTNNEEWAEKLRALRVHGSRKRYYHDWVGVNSRLDSLQAAVLLVKLQWLDEWTAARQQVAALYDELLTSVPVIRPCMASTTTRHVYNQYVILAEQRDELREHLTAGGIGTDIYYPLPMRGRSAGIRGDGPARAGAADVSGIGRRTCSSRSGGDRGLLPGQSFALISAPSFVLLQSKIFCSQRRFPPQAAR